MILFIINDTVLTWTCFTLALLLAIFGLWNDNNNNRPQSC